MRREGEGGEGFLKMGSEVKHIFMSLIFMRLNNISNDFEFI
jgi:hypothetical protein